MELRDYQRNAIDHTWMRMNADKERNPCIVLPTGSGKSPVIATIAQEAVANWGCRVIVLSHVKELLGQLQQTCKAWYPGLDVGVYSAGLNSRETDNDVVIAGIQSVYKRAHEFGRRHFTIIDEAHLIPEHEDGMFRQFINDITSLNGNHRVIGLTATPYRTGAGEICAPDNVLNYESYRAEIAPLIAAGYLSRLQNDPAAFQVNCNNVRKVAGEFAQGEVEELFMNQDNMKAAAQIAQVLQQGREAALVFCSGVRHATRVADLLDKFGVPTGLVYGDLPPIERETQIQKFLRGEFKALCNVNVLTTGFDATHVDLVAVLRATTSPGLFYQMCGRGFRLHPGKEDCLVLDFGGNIERHGALDSPEYGVEALNAWKAAAERKEEREKARVKECPACGTEVAVQTKTCPCGFEFPPSMMPVDPDATNPILQGDLPAPQWVEIHDVEYDIHYKSGWTEGMPRTMKVSYRWSDGLRDWPYCEWVCFEHKGFARQKAEKWWKARSYAPVPNTVEEAVHLCNFAVAEPTEIMVGHDVKNPKYKRITEYRMKEIPEWNPESAPQMPQQDNGDFGYDPGQGINSFLENCDDNIPF